MLAPARQRSVEEVKPSADDTTHRSEEDINSLFRMELGFFEVLKVIASKTRVNLTVPEMFIYGFGFPSATMICTDYATGELKIREGISKAAVYEACVFFESLTHRRGSLPVAVHKLASTTYFNDISTPQFSAEEAFSTWSRYLTQNRAQVLQRFVPAGLRVAALVKATWDGRQVRKVLMVNKKTIVGHANSVPELRMTESFAEEIRRRCFVLKKSGNIKTHELQSSRYIDSKVIYLVRLLEKYYLPSSDLKISFLEADFMQDEKEMT